MPTIPLNSDTLAHVLSRGWTHWDAHFHLSTAGGSIYEDREGLVIQWGTSPVIHAIEPEAFGPTSHLLSTLLRDLPNQLELRAGQAAGGILAETHHIEMVGPFRRYRFGPPKIGIPRLLSFEVPFEWSTLSIKTVASYAAALPEQAFGFLDCRYDMRERHQMLVDAGFEEVGAYERWIAIRH